MIAEPVMAEKRPMRRRHGVRLKPLWWLGRRRVREFATGVKLDPFPGRRLRTWFRKDTMGHDLRAGANVALLGFPQSVAYAFIAGVPAQFGIFSGIIGGILGPLFSGSRFIALGTTNATAVLIFLGMSKAGVPEAERLIALPIFVFLVGLFQLLGSFVRVSVLLAYVSRTVVTGYITAAAALIIALQVPNALGFRISGASTFFGTIAETLRNLHLTRWQEVVIALATVGVDQLFRRFLPRLPNVACTLLVMALAGVGLEYAAGWEFAKLAAFSLGELHFLNLHLDPNLMARLAVPAMALAFVALLEGSSVGKNLASRSGERINVAQETYAMGVCNLVSSVAGGMDTSGSLTRSALNHASGARTPLSAIISGLLIAVLLVTVGFQIDRIPKAALAVVVMGIGVSLFNRHHIRAALRTTGSDALTFIITFSAALLLTLDTAIIFGIIASLMLFLRKAGVPELIEYKFNDEGQLAEVQDRRQRSTPQISILHAEGDLFFGSTEIFVEQTRQVIQDPQLKVVILRLKNARNLDATAVLAIEELLSFLRQNGRELIVSGADAEVRRAFANSGLLARLGRENFFAKVPGNPNLSTRQALKRAQKILGPQQADIRIFVDATKKKAEGEE